MIRFLVSCQRALFSVLLLLVGVGSAPCLGGCLVDADHPCGPNQSFDQRTFSCLCEKGFALSAKGNACVACGANEVASNLTCVCQPGFVRDGKTGACQQTKLGSSCHPTQKPCTDTTYKYCHSAVPGGEGYCTSIGCAGPEDCSEGFACDTQRTPSFCRRPPTGQGERCETQQDCQGFDASYCESNTRKCMVIDCVMADPTACSAGWRCCDLSQLPLADLPQTVCAPESTIPTLKVYGVPCQGD